MDVGPVGAFDEIAAGKVRPQAIKGRVRQRTVHRLAIALGFVAIGKEGERRAVALRRPLTIGEQDVADLREAKFTLQSPRR